MESMSTRLGQTGIQESGRYRDGTYDDGSWRWEKSVFLWFFPKYLTTDDGSHENEHRNQLSIGVGNRKGVDLSPFNST